MLTTRDMVGLLAGALALLPVAGAAADQFADLGIVSVSAVPLATGETVIDVTVEIGPGPDSPVAPVVVEIWGESGVAGGFEIVIPGEMSGVCCFNNGDCPEIEGYTALCHGTWSDDVGHLCHYRRTSSIVVPAVPGETLTAVIDPNGAHDELQDGARINNSVAMTVGDPVGEGAVTDLGIGSISVVASGPATHDVLVEVSLMPELVPAVGEVVLVATTASGDAYSASMALTGTFYLCCDSDCPSPPEGTVDCLGTCEDAGQSGRAICVYNSFVAISGLVAFPGETVTVWLESPGIVETGGGAGSNNVASVEVPGCPCDVNGDGRVFVDDLLEFLAGWFVGAPSAEFDGVEGVSVEDLLAFLSCWFVACG